MKNEEVATAMTSAVGAVQPFTSSIAGFTLTLSFSVATRDSSSKLGSPLAAPSVQHCSSKLGSAFGSRSNSSFFILHSSFKRAVPKKTSAAQNLC